MDVKIAEPRIDRGHHRVQAASLRRSTCRECDRRRVRVQMRIHDPLKQWKLSPMDLESRRRWEEYTKAKETMLERTHLPEAPWWVVPADDKKKARLNCIDHLLSQVPNGEVEHPEVRLPQRVRHEDYERHPVPAKMHVPARY